MIGVINYGLGNLASVNNAFEQIGVSSIICSNPQEASKCDRLVLPGVGSFNAGMQAIRSRGWDVVISGMVANGHPLLGICLGMQLLLDVGEEHGPSDGLRLISGQVVRLEPDEPYKVPHVGWNSLEQQQQHPLLDGVRPNVDFYFVHSYHCEMANTVDVIATCDFGGAFVAGVARGNVAGFQFHPEKSQPAGMKILKNFADWDGQC